MHSLIWLLPPPVLLPVVAVHLLPVVPTLLRLLVLRSYTAADRSQLKRGVLNVSEGFS